MSAVLRHIGGISTAQRLALPAVWGCLALALLVLAMPSFAQAEAASAAPRPELVQTVPELRGTHDMEETTSAMLYGSAGGDRYPGAGAQIATFTLREIAVSMILLVIGGLVTILALSLFDDRNGELRR